VGRQEIENARRRFAAVAEGHHVAPECKALVDGAQSADLAGLLDDVTALIRGYVVVAVQELVAVALWVAHTWAFSQAEATPYLWITSAEKRSGKTRLLETLVLLVARAWLTGRVTVAVLVRKIAKETPTLLLDESDAAFRSEREYAEALRSILNNGHRRGGAASLCLNRGENYADLPVFCPKAIAGIGRLPDTVADRSILIVVKRRAPNEPVERFRRRQAEALAHPLREKLERWALGAVGALAEARPDIPKELDDRAADGWEPLLAIADAAGGEWPQRSREAALALSVGGGREDDSLGVRLLWDIKATFDERGSDRLTSTELVEALVAMEEAPWGDLRGKPLEARTLARMLRPYDVKSKTIRLDDSDGATAKGYHASWFTDSWLRYTPANPSQASQASQTPDSDRPVVTDVTDVTANRGIQTSLREDACGAEAPDDLEEVSEAW
jgi:hypothetical protein